MVYLFYLFPIFVIIIFLQTHGLEIVSGLFLRLLFIGSITQGKNVDLNSNTVFFTSIAIWGVILGGIVKYWRIYLARKKETINTFKLSLKILTWLYLISYLTMFGTQKNGTMLDFLWVWLGFYLLALFVIFTGRAMSKTKNFIVDYVDKEIEKNAPDSALGEVVKDLYGGKHE